VVRVTVEVARGATRYRVAVRAGSERRALEIVEKLSPGGDPRVVFTDAPGMLSVDGSASRAGGRERLAA
jgi:hypothetical protein